MFPLNRQKYASISPVKQGGNSASDRDIRGTTSIISSLDSRFSLEYDQPYFEGRPVQVANYTTVEKEMTESKGRSKVRADIRRNRLYITLSGAISKKEVENIYTDIRFCVADLKPGFQVITDLTQARIGHLVGIPAFIKIMEYLAANKVGKVIRVVGKAKIILQQMSRITAMVKKYAPVYVSTMEEAENLLSDLEEDKSE
jgi:hypothetical protein